MRAVIITVLVLLAAGRAEADNREAERLKKQALRHYQDGKFSEAAREFRAAHALDPDPELLYALGQALRLAGDCPGAVKAFEEFLATTPRESQAVATREKIDACGGATPPPPEPALDPAPGPGAQLPLTTTITAPPPPGPAWYKDLVGGGLVGGGVLAIGAGSWFIVDARRALAALERADSEEEFLQARAEVDRTRWRNTFGITLVGVGAGLVAGGVVRYVLVRRDRSAEQPIVSASVDRHGAGLFVMGAF